MPTETKKSNFIKEKSEQLIGILTQMPIFEEKWKDPNFGKSLKAQLKKFDIDCQTHDKELVEATKNLQEKLAVLKQRRDVTFTKGTSYLDVFGRC